jgi:hypothetical protein
MSSGGSLLSRTQTCGGTMAMDGAATACVAFYHAWLFIICKMATMRPDDVMGMPMSMTRLLMSLVFLLYQQHHSPLMRTWHQIQY